MTFTSSDLYTSNHCCGARGAGQDSGSPTGRAPDNSATSYLAPCGDAVWSATEDNVIIFPSAGVLKNFYIKLDADVGGGSKSLTFTYRKNGSDTTSVITIAGSNDSGSDLIHTITVAAGDKISIKCVPANTPTEFVATTRIAFTFQSNAANQFPMFAVTGQTSFPDPSYRQLSGCDYILIENSPNLKSDHQNLLNGCTFKKVYFHLSAAPGSGNSKVLTLQKNTVHTGSLNPSESDYVATALTVTISNSNTDGNATADVSFADGDRGVTEVVMNSSPDVSFESISYLVEVPVANPTTLPVDGTEGYCPYVVQGQVRKMVTAISGIDHLEGETIEVQADGLPVNGVFVVDSGAITLPRKAAVVHVGLPYDGKIKLLKSSDGNIQGSGQMKMRRIFMTGIRVFRSLGFKIGIDEDHLDPVILGKPKLPLVTDDLTKLPDTTWKPDSQLIIVQDKPQPLFITALIGRSEVEVIN